MFSSATFKIVAYKQMQVGLNTADTGGRKEALMLVFSQEKLFWVNHCIEYMEVLYNTTNEAIPNAIHAFAMNNPC